MKERTAAYIRVSTAEQKLHGFSLDAQRETLKRYADTHDLEIVEWYEDEGISGRKEVRKRPALQRMMNDAEKEQFQRIIFIKLDRYFRSVGEYYACQKILDKHNILWSATNEDYDLTTATGRLLVSQKLAIAEYEADNTSERIKLVNEYKVKQGRPLFGANSCMVGFTVIDTPEGKIMGHDPEKEEMAKDIIATYLRTQSLVRTVTTINDRYSADLDAQKVKRFLKSTLLYGSYRGNDSYCKPYIDKDTYDKIQELLSRNVKKAPSGREYIFTGVLLCPVCGRRLAAHTTRPKGQIYTYYRCPRRDTHGACTFRPRISEKKLEQCVLDNLETMLGAFITDFQSKAKAVKLIDTDGIKAEMIRLNRMYQKGRLTEKEYDKEYNRAADRLKEAEITNKNASYFDPNKYQTIFNPGWKEKYALLDARHKREFWRGIIKEVHFSQNGDIENIIFF